MVTGAETLQPSHKWTWFKRLEREKSASLGKAVQENLFSPLLLSMSKPLSIPKQGTYVPSALGTYF